MAFEKFGDDVGRILIQTKVEDGKNVGMIQHAGGFGFLLKAAQAFAIFGHGSGQHLDGDIAAQASVTRTVDLAHASTAEKADDGVGP